MIKGWTRERLGQREGEKGQWLGRLREQRMGELGESRRQQKGEVGAVNERNEGHGELWGIGSRGRKRRRKKRQNVGKRWDREGRWGIEGLRVRRKYLLFSTILSFLRRWYSRIHSS